MVSICTCMRPLLPTTRNALTIVFLQLFSTWHAHWVGALGWRVGSFDSLGEYLIKKGADDSLKNGDGLTCYEGLNAAQMEDAQM